MNDRPSAPDGIQLRLVPPGNAAPHRPHQRLTAGEVGDFTAMVFFVLNNLTVEDKRRVLRWASHLVDLRQRMEFEESEEAEVLPEPDHGEGTRR